MSLLCDYFRYLSGFLCGQYFQFQVHAGHLKLELDSISIQFELVFFQYFFYKKKMVFILLKLLLFNLEILKRKSAY